MRELDYVVLTGSEFGGSLGSFGVRIEVAASKLPDMNSDAMTEAAHKARGIIEEAIQAALKAADPETSVQTESNKRLVDLFTAPIFVEEFPNGDCSKWCCRHLPWFKVTTTAGPIEIGHRKRDISIDWSETRGTATAAELFPDANVTKGVRYIHAWGIVEAKRYVDAIMASAPVTGE